ncbi:EF-hand domain-containing protein [Streptomyces sp. NPDC058644]|uniref:EF-hand domain-containing protein n=1 Tax=unclassified Streptomyces TaxID=2593676 RepID=UPI00366042F6
MAQEQNKMLWDRFNELNADGTGVSQKDVRAILVGEGGLKPADVEALLRDVTGGTEARIDARNFSAIVPKPPGAPTEQVQRMQDAFKALDTDGTGITESQLRQLLMDLGSALTSPEVEDLMKEVVVNGEGRITYDAFADMLVTGYPLASE